jgi:hypothetical protein
VVQQHVIIEPEPFGGRDVRQIVEWAESTLTDPDEFEAVVLLRRAMQISGSRYLDMDQIQTAGFFNNRVMGGCFVYQPDMVEKAKRNVGSTRDFTSTPDALLADVKRSN